MFARFRDCEDDSTAGPEGVGDDSREAAKVRASHLSIRPKMGFVALSFDELNFVFFLPLFDSAERIHTECLLSQWIWRR